MRVRIYIDCVAMFDNLKSGEMLIRAVVLEINSIRDCNLKLRMKNYRVAVMLVLPILASLCLFVASANGFFFSEKPYEKISKQLKKAVSSDNDIQANLQEARRWSERVGSKKLTGFNGSLKNFTRLAECLNESSCNRFGQEVLERNGEMFLDSLSSRRPMDRAHKIFKAVVREHSKICRPKYLERFEGLKKSLSKNVLERVEKLFPRSYYDAHINLLFGSHDPIAFENLIAHDSIGPLRAIGSIFTVRYAYDAILEDARNMDDKLPNGRLDLVKLRQKQCAESVADDEVSECYTNLLELYKLSVYDNCKRYVDHFGPDVFGPHTTVLMWSPLSANQEGTSKEPTGYELAWYRYIICSNVNMNAAKNEVKDIIRIIRGEGLNN